jgi:hypothetical protein
MLDYIITEDREDEETSHHKNIREMIEEPSTTCDDEDFTQEEIKQTIESFSDKKSTRNRRSYKSNLLTNI